MDELIAKRILGREARREEAPIILDEDGNTASASATSAGSAPGQPGAQRSSSTSSRAGRAASTLIDRWRITGGP